ncbi:hypothetical protein [Amycolatopsis sacchari]|uniref:hypothetical protein n=1 Tax=Amycolatopsis sacchari TaxID=115433 RepID=UPI003D724C6C
MGKGSRKRRKESGLRSHEAALFRLIENNPPGRLSLAGAYALGYCSVGVAQRGGEAPDWFGQIDPLDLVLIGLVAPKEFASAG